MPRKRSVPAPAFDVRAYLDAAGVSPRVARFARGAVIFAQGDPARHVFYLQTGTVKLSVLATTGKEAVVALLGAGEFFGEGVPGRISRPASARRAPWRR